MSKLDRRRFIITTASMLAAASQAHALWPFSGKSQEKIPPSVRGRVAKGEAPKALWKWSKEGYAYKKLSDDRVVCGICPHRCLMAPGDRSVCRSKVNHRGKLYSIGYGNPCSANIDPIEKKPLYHFKPRVKAFSLAVAGCNFRCLNCQNWEISQRRPEDLRNLDLFPETAVKTAIKYGAQSIAYTYSEAVTFFEYMWDTARLAKTAGIDNLWISNGYINPKPLNALCEYLDAANVNLKSIDDNVYRALNGGRLKPVLNTFETLRDRGVHFEITNLVVPTYVDDPDMVKRLCNWIVTHLGPDRPLHFLRFYPRYKLDRLPPTPISTLLKCRQIALEEGLRYAYTGGIAHPEANNTYCHNCGNLLIERQGFYITAYHLEGSHCRYCQTKIPGVWHPQGLPA